MAVRREATVQEVAIAEAVEEVVATEVAAAAVVMTGRPVVRVSVAAVALAVVPLL